jgi:hypothetical protein
MFSPFGGMPTSCLPQRLLAAAGYREPPQTPKTIETDADGHEKLGICLYRASAPPGTSSVEIPSSRKTDTEPWEPSTHTDPPGRDGGLGSHHCEKTTGLTRKKRSGAGDVKRFPADCSYPANARCRLSISSFVICIMARNTRWDFAVSGSLSNSNKSFGTICQERPNLSFSHPHC